MTVEVVNVVQNTPQEADAASKGFVDQAGIDSFKAAEAAMAAEETSAADKPEDTSAKAAEKAEEKPEIAEGDKGGEEAGEEGDTPADGEAPPAKPALTKGQQKKVDRAAAAARRQAEADATAAREEAARLRAENEALKAGKQPAKQAPSDDVEPSPEDFEYGTLDPAYQKAVRAYDKAQLKKELLADQQAKAAEAKASETVAKFEERVDAFLEVHDDYYEKVEDGLREGKWVLPSAFGDVIMDSAAAPQVLYHLAENPKIAAKINALPAARQLIELGKLEVQLAPEAPATKEKTQTARVSKAEPPAEVVRGSNGKFQVNSATTNFSEFERTHSHLLNQ